MYNCLQTIVFFHCYILLLPNQKNQGFSQNLMIILPMTDSLAL
ncbi:hypothetical protein PCC7424_1218 [Gloeothece citriformis PCC 7424]|uniref:Uncharacterized protein n=1 Tax=Gloeothece citriformis (strain PCC 7424) TaxID=65393 RepID=B7K798_GLOC7|nr:hypothetical protein PCC7424_1218 [Gloeothece citriformis PCC 7424]